MTAALLHLLLAETENMVVFEQAGAQRKQWEGNGRPLVAMLQEKELETQTYSGQDSRGKSRILFSSVPTSASSTHDDIATSDQKEGTGYACTCMYMYDHVYAVHFVTSAYQ